MAAGGNPQSQRQTDLVAMGTMIKLPKRKHKSVNTNTEDVAINTHHHVWNDTVNTTTALKFDFLIRFHIKKSIICVACEEK